MESRLLLDVVVGESTSILELLSGEDQSLLIWWNSFLVLDLSLDILDGIGGLDFEGNSLTRQSLDEDLHDENFSLPGSPLMDSIYRKSRGQVD